MNKKLISLAVAAALSAPAAAMADATLYGKLHISIDFFKIGEDGYKGWTLNRGKVGKGDSRANRVGIKGSEELSSGLKAIYQVELGVPLANLDEEISNGDKGGITMRDTYVGLSSESYGTLLVGRHDTPLKMSTLNLELFADTTADYGGTIGFDDIRADSTIVYLSPTYEGFQFAAAFIPGAGLTATSVDENLAADDLGEGYSLAAIYSNGPWYTSLAYESLSDEFGATYRDYMVPGDMRLQPGLEDYTKWRGGVGIRDWNGMYVSGIVENWEGKDFWEDKEAFLWQLQFGYEFGPNMVKMMYGEKDWDYENYEDKASWALGLDHKFSKRTKGYLLYTEVDLDEYDDQASINKYRMEGDDDWSAFSMGVVHKF